MWETSIINNLNCKIQAHARVYKENKELALEEKQLLPIKNFYWKIYYQRPPWNTEEMDFSVLTCDHAS